MTFFINYLSKISPTQNPMDEMLQFLKLDSKLDLKIICVDYLLKRSGSEEGITQLLEHDQVMLHIIELTKDTDESVSKYALMLILNVSVSERGATDLMKCKPSCYRNIIELFISYILNEEKKEADLVCSILSNITKQKVLVNVCIDTFMLHLNDIVNVFANLTFNKSGSKLHHIAQMLHNLSVSPRVRKWLTEENPHIPLIKILPFCNYRESLIRMGGVLSLIRNLSLDSQYREFLLSNELDLLSHLLLPIMGNEEFIDEEMDQLPMSLQYLPKEKQREGSYEIRKTVLESLINLCATRKCREILRANGVYFILREYHKWEKDASLLLMCENVVDILIQKESEVGADDLSKVEVPDHLKAKFRKMDEDYIKNRQQSSTDG